MALAEPNQKQVSMLSSKSDLCGLRLKPKGNSTHFLVRLKPISFDDPDPLAKASGNLAKASGNLAKRQHCL